MPLATAEDEEESSLPLEPKGVTLSASDKWCLVKPLLMRYMLPLCKLHPLRLEYHGQTVLICHPLVFVYMVSTLPPFR